MADSFKLVPPGATMLENNNCLFKVWAPLKESMELHLISLNEKKLAMTKDADGYFSVEVAGVKPGHTYFFIPESQKGLPDPASNFQPDGVNGPSEVVDHKLFSWQDYAWKGMPFKDLVLYELHVGTFTPEGTFEAIIPRIDQLLEVGINALEILPVSQFSGSRNWGYDGTYPYAIQNSYGGPDGLKKLVNTCHQKGMAVFLDVVYNHLGPEGNYFSEYGPYFTNKYCTPWGNAINLDGDWSDGPREYFCQNALFLLENYHLDGLRLDAIHMAFDNGAVPFWRLVNNKIKELEKKVGRPLYTIAESDLNSLVTINSPDIGGYGFNSQWLDDFHHSLYVLLDKKGKERYYDFGRMEQLAKAYTDGFVHTGEFVEFRKRRYGSSSAGITGERFVAFNLNHDQVGNRVKGERLCLLVDFERLKLAAAALLLAPYVPMLFMGEEYADKSPFFYFVSHSDQGLIEAVRKGRAEEFAGFKSEGTPPDPQDEKTFLDSKLNWNKRSESEHLIMLNWHKELLTWRKKSTVLQNFNKSDIKAYVIGQDGLVLWRQTGCGRHHLLILMNFSEKELKFTVPVLSKKWNKILDSKENKWSSSDAENFPLPFAVSADEIVNMQPLSIVVYQNQI